MPQRRPRPQGPEAGDELPSNQSWHPREPVQEEQGEILQEAVPHRVQARVDGGSRSQARKILEGVKRRLKQGLVLGPG